MEGKRKRAQTKAEVNSQTDTIVPVLSSFKDPLLCDICQKNKSRYTFVCCSWKHCGIECYNLHKSTSTQLTSTGKDSGSTAPCGGPLKLRLSRFRSRDREIGNSNLGRKKNETLFHVHSLTEKQKRNLEENPVLKKWFASKAIRRDVRSIRNSTNEKERLSVLLQDAEFASFIWDIASSLEIPHLELHPTAH